MFGNEISILEMHAIKVFFWALGRTVF